MVQTLFLRKYKSRECPKGRNDRLMHVVSVDWLTGPSDTPHDRNTKQCAPTCPNELVMLVASLPTSHVRWTPHPSTPTTVTQSSVCKIPGELLMQVGGAG